LNGQYAHTTAKTAALPDRTNAAAQDWTYTHTVQSKPVVFVRAKDFQEIEGKYHLTGVELHIFHKDAKEFDQVKTAKAEFDINQGMLFSEGDVEITMGVPANAEPSGRL